MSRAEESDADWELATALEPVAAGRYGVALHPGFWGAAAAHGGYLACLALLGMQAEVQDGSQTPRSLSVHFLRGPDPGPAELVVERVRAGRRVSTFSARLLQQGRPICLALGAWGAGQPDVESFCELSMPKAPAPEEVPRQVPSRSVPVDHRLELRPCLGAAAFSAADSARSGGWARPVQALPLDACTLTLLADGFWPCLFTRLTDKRQAGAAPTLSLTLHFRTRLPRPERGQYVLVDLATRALADGYLDESARLWAADGTLLAESTQLALRVPPTRT